MCQSCSNCNGITFFSGTDGVGITSITDNNNGTFTILLSNGTTWTSGDLTGPQGATGTAGTNGTNGTNAFKFVKEYTSVNPSTFTALITREELESCVAVPEGCLFEGILPASCDLHVQIWLKNAESEFWFRVFDVNHIVSVWETAGTYGVGDIFIAFQDMSSSTGNTVRIVVIA